MSIAKSVSQVKPIAAYLNGQQFWRLQFTNELGESAYPDATYPEKLDAAIGACEFAAKHGRCQVYVDDATLDQLVCHYRLEGMALYLSGHRLDCWNEFMREGYDAASQDDMAKGRNRVAWPTAVGEYMPSLQEQVMAEVERQWPQGVEA